MCEGVCNPELCESLILSRRLRLVGLVALPNSLQIMSWLSREAVPWRCELGAPFRA